MLITLKIYSNINLCHHYLCKIINKHKKSKILYAKILFFYGSDWLLSSTHAMVIIVKKENSHSSTILIT